MENALVVGNSDWRVQMLDKFLEIQRLVHLWVSGAVISTATALENSPGPQLYSFHNQHASQRNWLLS